MPPRVCIIEEAKTFCNLQNLKKRDTHLQLFNSEQGIAQATVGINLPFRVFKNQDFEKTGLPQGEEKCLAIANEDQCEAAKAAQYKHTPATTTTSVLLPFAWWGYYSDPSIQFPPLHCGEQLYRPKVHEHHQ